MEPLDLALDECEGDGGEPFSLQDVRERTDRTRA